MKIRLPALYVLLILLLVSTPGHAMDDKAKGAAIGAAVALGVAALVHNRHHHKDNEHREDQQYEMDYERGFNDAMHGARFDTQGQNEAYRAGYDAGYTDRDHRVAYNQRNTDHHKKTHQAPPMARKACIGEASARWGVRPQYITPVKSRKEGSDDFMVEVVSGYQHGRCEASRDGQIYLFENGRI